jgi:hypothetical protein
VYPYFRKQNIWFYDAYVSAGRSFAHGKNRYDLTLGALYGSGGGALKQDGEYAPPSSSQRPPRSLDNYLYQEHEYLTASRLGANLEATYSRLLLTQLSGYLSARYELTRAAKTEYISDNAFNLISLSIGCKF